MVSATREKRIIMSSGRRNPPSPAITNACHGSSHPARPSPAAVAAMSAYAARRERSRVRRLTRSATTPSPGREQGPAVLQRRDDREQERRAGLDQHVPAENEVLHLEAGRGRHVRPPLETEAPYRKRGEKPATRASGRSSLDLRPGLQGGGSDQRGRSDLPIRCSSTARAACRPSRIAHTTSDWPRRMSPQANTLVDRGPVVAGIGEHVAPGVEVDPEVGQHALVLRVQEPHREEDEIGRELEVSALDLDHPGRRAGAVPLPLDARAGEGPDPSVLGHGSPPSSR